MSVLHLNTGGVLAGTSRREVRRCWGACGIADAPVVTLYGSPYYAPISLCTICGDSWSEGLHERPFVRGWRQEAIARAVAKWEAACGHPLRYDDDLYPVPCEVCAR